MSHPVATWPVLPDPVSGGSILDATGVTTAPGVDLLLDSDGDLVVDSDAHLTTGLAAVAQAIRIRLQMFRGEWFWDLDFGIPYLPIEGVPEADALLGQKFNELKSRAAFREMIEATPEVDSVDLSVTFNRATRITTVTFRAVTTFGVVEDEVEV